MTIIRELISDNAQVSLLSREESTALKGLLISLVLLGHDKYLMAGGYSFIFLYSFHIYSFYFLPFLYCQNRHEFGRYIWQNLKRFYLPYLICCSVVLAISYYIGRQFVLIDVIQGILEGHPYGALSIGSFLWFLPTMFALLIIKELYYRCSFIGRVSIFTIGSICFLHYGFGWFDNIFGFLPFFVRNGFAFLVPGLLARYVFLHTHRKEIFSLLFIFIVIADFILIPNREFYSYKIMTRYLGTVGIFLFLVSISDYLKTIHIFKALGQYSFPIYLVHIFIYNLFYLVIDRYIGSTYWLGLLLYFVVVSLSYYVSVLYSKIVKS